MQPCSVFLFFFLEEGDLAHLQGSQHRPRTFQIPYKITASALFPTCQTHLNFFSRLAYLIRYNEVKENQSRVFTVASWEISAGAEQEKRFSPFFQRGELECHPLALWKRAVEILSVRDMSSRMAFGDAGRKSSWVLPLTKSLVLCPSVSCLQQTQGIRNVW